jgi:hypothetical protein
MPIGRILSRTAAVYRLVDGALLLLGLTLACVAAAPAAATDAPPVLAHRAEVTFDTAEHTVRVADRLEVPAGLAALRLGEGFDIEEIRVIDNTVVDPRVAVTLEKDDDGRYLQIDLAKIGMRNGGVMLLVYVGSFHQAVDDVQFSREKVGGEITATIGDEGIYLSGAAGWLPWAPDVMATHDMTFDTPAGFETVTQGERTQHVAVGDRLRTRWTAAHPSDGLNLIANRYVVSEEPVRDGVVSYTFLLSDDARLRDLYMERTRAYVAMYEEMIGPYPYTKFATVENWFPTGYGMPGWTLLGGQVLRLPFIPYTSFGHEIAHNWWGNSVFVDTDEGNWCEGLTVYCADYHYKQLESDAAAREYRRTLLKDYAAYVKDPAQDFPLSEFRSRHSGATRAVGYGKSMMVFHMIERSIGRDAFVAGMREVAASHQFRPAAWSDFLAAFSRLGAAPLPDGFAAQWLERAGAPELALSDVEFAGDKVRFTLRQAGPAYALQVPVVVTTADGAVEHVLDLDAAEKAFEIAAAGASKVAVDPDCHLFRKLDPAEIEPTLSQILGDEAPHFVLGDGAGAGAAGAALQAAALEFAKAFSEDDATELLAGSAPADGRAAVVINPGPDQLAAYATPGLEMTGGMAFLEGRRYKLADNDVVFAARDPQDPSRSHLVIVCGSADRLASLARRVVHYGKYSWLVMPAGQGRPERGNWAPGASPLVAVR